MKSRDLMFEERFANLGRLPGRTEFNWDQALDESKETTLEANTWIKFLSDVDGILLWVTCPPLWGKQSFLVFQMTTLLNLF